MQEAGAYEPITLEKAWPAAPIPSVLLTFPPGNTFRVTISMSCEDLKKWEQTASEPLEITF